MAMAAAGGWATDAERATLQLHQSQWAGALRRLVDDTEDGLSAAESLSGEERFQVVADFREELDRLAAALADLTGEDRRPRQPAPPPAPVVPLSTEPLLQGSWAAGRIVVWAGSPGGGPAAEAVVDKLLAATDGGAVPWKPASPVVLPDGSTAPARSAPLEDILGWLVGVGAGAPAGAAPSLRWLGEIARWGTELVAQGRMVPSLRRSGRDRAGSSRRGTDRYRVRWVPAVVEPRRLRDLTARAPGAVTAVERTARPEVICRSALATVVDAVCRAGAGRLVTPATVEVARNPVEVAEAVLSGLDGTAFLAAVEPASQLAERLAEWATPVTAEVPYGLLVRLDPPEPDGGWQLSVQVTGVDGGPLEVERALAVVPRSQARQVEALFQRAERLLAVLNRSSTRRGQVILSADEAAELLFSDAAALLAAGFEVSFPAFSNRRPRPRLQLVAEGRGSTEVGVRQLSQVHWSVVFGDAELDAREIARLAAEARPLVQVNGRWVRLDQGDLRAAATALREHSGITEMSGAAILRYAVGLGGDTLGGPVQVAGSGWAVDLVRGATVDPPAPLAAPKDFNGELRSYQAEAAGWLAFLERAGLGGCLAMDMGLGKTPTVLAHLLAHRGETPSLVICPPAVLGNWSHEAARFTPKLRVAMHHGATRADAATLARIAARNDVVLTTYATAMRDVDALAAIAWRQVIVDEAQAIKNPASDTAQALRRIPATTRLAMTGTPVENGLGDLWAILDFTNPGLVGSRTEFIEQLSRSGSGEPAGERALRALNGLLVFRRTKTEPLIAKELSDKIDVLDHCTMTPEQIGLYQAILDRLLDAPVEDDEINVRKAHVLAAITALKQVCDHPAAYLHDDQEPLVGRSGKLERLEEIVANVFEAGERVLIFTHFARWGEKLATYLTERTGRPVPCYHGGLSRTVRDNMVHEFQTGTGPAALVLSLKAGGAGLNLTAASHVVLYDRWWNPAVEDQARDRAWRIGQTRTVISHRLVCPGTIDERVEEVVAGKRHIANLVLPARSTLGDLGRDQLRAALGLSEDVLVDDDRDDDDEAAA